MAPTVDVTLRVEITSDQVVGWHPRDRKDLQAAIDDVAFRVCEQLFTQGATWSAMLTRTEDVEAENWLLRMVEKLRTFGSSRLCVPKDMSMAVIHERCWTIDPFQAVSAEDVYPGPKFARDGLLFDIEPDEVYLHIDMLSEDLPTHPSKEVLLSAVADTTPEGLDFGWVSGINGGWSNQGGRPAFCGNEDHAGLGDTLVLIAAVLRNAGFPPDTRLLAKLERSWWIEQLLEDGNQP